MKTTDTQNWLLIPEPNPKDKTKQTICTLVESGEVAIRRYDR